MRDVNIEVTLEDQVVIDAAICKELYTGKYCTVIYPHNISSNHAAL